MLVRTNVNGERRERDVWPGSSLLYLLREHLGLPGSKNACEQGECGSCSVWLDGELVCSCLVLAAQAKSEVPPSRARAGGRSIRCRRRSSGRRRAMRVLRQGSSSRSPTCSSRFPSRRAVRRRLELCRCTGYEKILEAVRLASDRMRIREDEL
jgi:carbon-monoxide dehydrogenase small subunit